MNRLFHPATRRRIAALLVLSTVVMGVPWIVVHAHASVEDAHEHHTAVADDLALDVHLEHDHTNAPRSDADHVHDCGLFAHHPGVAGSLELALLDNPATAAYLEPPLLSPCGHHSPLLRPPART